MMYTALPEILPFSFNRSFLDEPVTLLTPVLDYLIRNKMGITLRAQIAYLIETVDSFNEEELMFEQEINFEYFISNFDVLVQCFLKDSWYVQEINGKLQPHTDMLTMNYSRELPTGEFVVTKHGQMFLYLLQDLYYHGYCTQDMHQKHLRP